MKQRLLRFAIAIAVAGIVAAQMPATSNTAFAQGTYPSDDDDGGSDYANAVGATIGGLAIYGIVTSLAAGKKSGLIVALPSESPSPSPSPVAP